MKISIIIPAWNVEKYIVKCIESCQRLRRAEFEIIVVNDGSTDNTVTVIEENFYDLKNLHVYTTENRGLSAARNYGMEKANGDYIVFLDADDWLRTDINRIFEDELLLKDVDVLYFCCQYIDELDENRFYMERPFPIDCDRTFTGEEVLRYSMNHFACSGFTHYAWSGIYSKEFLINKGITFLNGILYEDYDFWFKVMREADHVKFSNIIGYGYRLRSNSITHVGFSKKVIESCIATINSVLSPDYLSDSYLACASANIELLLIYCELRTSPEDYIAPSCKLFEYILENKFRILKLVDTKYSEDTQDKIKMKYRLLSHLVFCFGVYDDLLMNRVWTLRDKILSSISDEMKNWGLDDENKHIGFYGIGEQSDIIPSTYKALFGNINADCFYVDSKMKSYSKKHYNRRIVNVGDLDKEQVDGIVICSNYFENEMRAILEKQWPEIPVYSVYKNSPYSLMWVFCGNYAEIYLRLEATKGQRRIILLETPEYSNVGDQLITVAEYGFFEKYFPGVEVIEITNDEYSFYKCRINRMISDEDILVITGGGFFGSLWRERHYDQALDIMERYPRNEVWVMPQSIFFEDNENGIRYKEYTKKALKRDNLKIVVREKYSETAIKSLDVLNEENIYLAPDIALYHIFDKKIERRESIGVFIRGDKESVLEKSELELINRYMVYSGLEILTSTTHYNCKVHKEERRLVVEEKIEEIASFKIVITDQLHCMIICAITGTPCIAFDNISKKVGGVYEYLSDASYIRFLSDTSHFQKTFDELLKINIDGIEKICFEKEWKELAGFLKKCE